MKTIHPWISRLVLVQVKILLTIVTALIYSQWLAAAEVVAEKVFVSLLTKAQAEQVDIAIHQEHDVRSGSIVYPGDTVDSKVLKAAILG